MEILANDFVILPIIVTDYDAILTKTSATTTHSSSPNARSSSANTIQTASSTTHSPILQNFQTGFTDFADDWWSRMNNGMKQKLRAACVEVLKRTDDPIEEEKMGWVFDEDARFLD